jgi:hypothetical protein
MKKPQITLIATLPKSGTWYSHTFFWYYDQLLRHTDEYLAETFQPDLEGTLRDRKITLESHHADTLGFDKLYIIHSICPGFHELNDPRYSLWQTLHFPNAGYNLGEPHFNGTNEMDLLNPLKNNKARVIYLYRNPLDHFISYYHHTLKHVDNNYRLKVLPDGSLTPIKNLHEFVFEYGALGAFIKHYYSFKQMQQRFPDNVLMMPYEYLTTDPEHAFGKILEFIDAAPDNATKQILFKNALAHCSKESLAAIEKKINRALAGDQLGDEKHIRDGAIGKWQNQFSQDELAAIEAALNIFDISLNDFKLVNQDTGRKFTEIQSSTKQLFQAEFVKQQSFLSLTPITVTMKRELAEAKSLINSMKASHSWRITAPLRALVSMVKNSFASQRES